MSKPSSLHTMLSFRVPEQLNEEISVTRAAGEQAGYIWTQSEIKRRALELGLKRLKRSFINSVNNKD